MNKHLIRFIIFSLWLLLNYNCTGQEVNIVTTQDSIPAKVTSARLLGKIFSLGKIKPSIPHLNTPNIPRKKRLNPNIDKNPSMPPLHSDGLRLEKDPLVNLFKDNGFNKNTDNSPIINIDGIDETTSGIYVPDPVIDVGPHHVIQMTNSNTDALFQIFDKQGNTVYGPASCNTFWAPLGLAGRGDPIVLYDELADRWWLTEFASQADMLLIAVSVTGDPLGDWYAFEIQTPNFPDYPKYGIWPNALVVTSFETPDPNVPVYCLDRSAMLNGDASVAVVRFGMPKFNDTGWALFKVATPADLDGAIPPPAGSPPYILRMYDDIWEGGVDKLELWKAQLDWSNPSASILEGPIDLPTAPFNSNACEGGWVGNCFTDPGGTFISPLMHTLMHRVQYRNFGTHETIVLNHIVNLGGVNHTGIRWYELRKSGTSEWSIYQQGTYGPDADNRFMGSIAMDGSGNIAMGYSITGDTTQLSLRYTGRKKNDPLGQMTLNEYTFAQGASNQPMNRWGDYSSMNVDPVDQRTFWYTGEYRKPNEWGTRIVSFQMQRDSIDFATQSLDMPISSATLDDHELITATFKNVGLISQSNFEVAYQINNSLPIVETITATLDPDSSINFTFGVPTDMSAVENYEVTIFTNLMNDQFNLNDTLRQTISNLKRFDLASATVNGTSQIICDTSTIIQFVIQNLGGDTLNSADIHWQLNSSPVNEINWIGNLAMNERDSFDIDLAPLLDGSNTILIYTSSPNGMLDEDTRNDTLTRTFEANISGGPVSFELLTDNYPAETSWDLKDDLGTVLFSGGSYTTPQTLHTENWCLDTACYIFSIYDTFGDGLTRDGVEGHYKIQDSGGNILAAILMSNFGSQEDNGFCYPYAGCTMTATTMVTHASAIGIDDGTIMVTPINGIAPFEYSLDGGITFQTGSIFSGLGVNDYTILIKDANQCETEVIATISVCNLLVNFTVSNESGPGIEDGIISIDASNGTPPYEYSIDGGLNYQLGNIFNNLSNGTYDVVVKDALACTYFSMVDLGTTSIVIPQDVSIKFFPNPFSSNIKIEVKGLNLSVLKVEVYDTQGKIVERGRLVRYNEVLLGNLYLHASAKGSYFIRLKGKTFDRIFPIIKI